MKIVGSLFTTFVALISTIAAMGFFQLGQNCQWTSDGPGILIFMGGMIFAGIIALISWTILLGGLSK